MCNTKANSSYRVNLFLNFSDGDEGMKAGSCPSRAESPPMNTKTISLIVQNYFPDNPDFSTSCRDNSAPLRNMVKTCYDASVKRWPNYIAVDFYEVYLPQYLLSHVSFWGS